jgi:iron complex outermembrane receptor protein
MDIKLDGYWRRHYDHFILIRSNPAIYENFHRTDVAGFNADTYFETKIGKTSVGVNYRYEKILSNVLGEDIANPIEVKSEDSAFYYKSYSRNYINGFVEQSLHLGNFNIVTGTLIEKNSESDKLQFFPGIDLSYRFIDNLKLYSSLNRSMRLPTFTDMFYVDPANEGTVNLKSEKIVSFEGGMSYSTPTLSANITYFYDHATDVIDWLWITDRNLYKATNLSVINTQGIETKVDVSFPDLPILEKLSVAYSTYDISKESNNLESKYVLDHLKHKLGIKSYFGFFEQFKFTFYTTYQERNGTYLVYDSEASATNTVNFKPYWLSDAKLSWNKNYLTIYVEANNVFDVSYIDVGSLIQPGRWLKAGVVVDLDL